MPNLTDRILAGLALLAAVAVWFPALPWPPVALVVLPAAALVPGRLVLARPGRTGAVMALSVLLVTATAWALSILPGTHTPIPPLKADETSHRSPWRAS